MSDRISSYAKAMVSVATAEGNLDTVSNELYTFARALDGSEELRMALTDRQIPAERRQQIVEDLLGGQATQTTVGLVSMVVGAGRAAELGDIADKMVELTASRHSRKVAQVRSAVALSDDQVSRLAAALERSTGSPVDVRVTIDPSVVGGIVTQIGETVIDGSVRSRLLQLREAF